MVKKDHKCSKKQNIANFVKILDKLKGGGYRMRDVGFGGSKNVGSGIWGVEICGIWDFRKKCGIWIWGVKKCGIWDSGGEKM